jgi:tRNA(fMet)-specific endonuclease VapC
MKYLLDTNICIYAQKRNAAILAHMKDAWQDGIAISAITLAELEYGVQHSAAPERNAIALAKFLSIVEILPFDSSAAIEYGDICSTLRRKGITIGTMDMLIAAHGRSEKLTVVTHNTREFELVKGLQLADWYE